MDDQHVLERACCKAEIGLASVQVAYQVQLLQDAAISLGETAFCYRQLRRLS
jgi:hypothetical protein